ncbi:MAG: hypothetical protein M3070_13240 [Actinomycetota bacterium]|nr:hypothetical protein [Actinomycetota bacterium]
MGEGATSVRRHPSRQRRGRAYVTGRAARGPDHLLSESQVGAYIAEGSAATTLETGRAQLGGPLGFPADDVALLESATAALQALLFAWPLPEHPSVAVAPSE